MNLKKQVGSAMLMACFVLVRCLYSSFGERTISARAHGQLSSSRKFGFQHAGRHVIGCSKDGLNRASSAVCNKKDPQYEELWASKSEGLQEYFDTRCKDSFTSCGPKKDGKDQKLCDPGNSTNFDENTPPVQNYRGGPLPEECIEFPLTPETHMHMLALVSNECSPEGEDLKQNTIAWAKTNFENYLQHYEITGTKTTICVIEQAFENQRKLMEKVPLVASSGVHRGDEEIAAMILTGMIRHIVFSYGVHKNSWHGRVKMSLINAMRTVQYVDEHRMMAASIEEANAQIDKLTMCPQEWKDKEGKSWCKGFVEDKKLCPIKKAIYKDGVCEVDVPRIAEDAWNPCYVVLQCEASRLQTIKVEHRDGKATLSEKCTFCKLPQWHVPCMAVSVIWNPAQGQCMVTRKIEAGYIEEKCQLFLNCSRTPKRQLIDWTEPEFGELAGTKRVDGCTMCELASTSQDGLNSWAVTEMRAVLPFTKAAGSR